MTLPEIPAPEATSPAPPAIAELSPAVCAARLAELFPAVFTAGAAKPLKLRIQADIQQRSPGIFTKKTLSIFLHRHTTSTAYLKALANAPARIDLDGQPAGEVADEHRQAAIAELARRQALHDARRAAERDAQRQAHQKANEEARRARALDDDARRDRAGLLRAFETTTLTRANFCALKGIAEAELEAALAQAREERAQAPVPQQRPQHPPAARAGERPDPRGRPPQGRPPRRPPRAA